MSSDDARLKKPSPKKPRVRHTEIQLAALNDLYEENEHPSLDERAALADDLKMDTRAVNAWFANKRSASKKKYRCVSALSKGTLTCFESREINGVRSEGTIQQLAFSQDEAEYDEINHHKTDHIKDTRQYESEINTVKLRQRPTAKQIEELRKMYKSNSHPSKEDRENLGIRIGMRYQSVTNWFQNQRGIIKKRQSDAGVDLCQAESKRLCANTFTPSALYSFPGPSEYGSHPSCSDGMNRTMARTKRVRPEPCQLEALRKLFMKTSNPSIEERVALSRDIGMDVEKVTNWFRNLRQTVRRRAYRGSVDEDDDSLSQKSASNSRPETPSPLSPITSLRLTLEADANDDRMQHDRAGINHCSNFCSDMGSDEDLQEAVTPPPVSVTTSNARDAGFDYLSPLTALEDTSCHNNKLSTGARVEDALLLLSFSRHISE